MNRETISSLLDVFEVDDGVISRIEAHGDEGRRALVALAKDSCEPDSLRGRAAYVLGRMGWRPAFFSVKDLLDDNATTVRLNAMHSLTSIGGPNAVGPLVDIISDAKRSPVDKAHALDCLGAVGDGATLQWLREWSKQQEALEMQKVACKAMRAIEQQLEAIDRDEEREIESYCRR